MSDSEKGKINILVKRGTVLLKIKGSFSAAAIARMMKSVLKHAEFRPEHDVLMELLIGPEEVSLREVSRAGALICNCPTFRAGGRWGIVVKNPLACAFVAVAMEHIGLPSHTFRLFSETNRARDWLEEDRCKDVGE